MKIIKSKKAVSEVIGTIILLAIAITLFSVVHIVVFAYPYSPPIPSVNMVASINEGVLTIKHNYGDPLNLDTKVIIRIGSKNFEKNASEYLDSMEKSNRYWSIGDSFEIKPFDNESAVPPGLNIDITEKYVGVTVVDIESNSVVMMADLQIGST